MGVSITAEKSFRPGRYHAAAALFFLVVGVVMYAPVLGELPFGLHAWAQADRLALAISYYDYGFHFFTPRTFNLSSIGGITGVEFPLQAYLAALGGLLFGRSSISPVFRLLDAAMALLGCYYLFRLVYERNRHFMAGLLPGIFILASPVFLFYAGSTLPDPFSLSLSFIGYYYWLRFFDNRHFPDLTKALLVLGLAALVKTTSLLHFGGVAGITLLWAFLQPGLLNTRQRIYFLGLMALVLGVVAAYFLRTQYLNATYQSGLFLAQARPISDPQTLHDVLVNVRGMWLSQYATTLQYSLLAVAGVLFFVYLRPNLRHYLPLTLLLLTSLGLGGLFVHLMGAQFRDHDYYIICSLFPPAMVLVLLAMLNAGRHPGKFRHVLNLGLAVLAVFLLSHGYKRLHRRMQDAPAASTYGPNWMRGGARELARAQVPPAAQVLVLNEPAPNLALVYFDRRGQVWTAPDLGRLTADELLLRMAADSLDYLIMDPAVYARLAPLHPALAAGLDVVGQQPAMVLRRRNRQHPW